LGDELRTRKTELEVNNNEISVSYSLKTDIGISWKLKLSTGEEE
jgi:hypothetical protein